MNRFRRAFVEVPGGLHERLSAYQQASVPFFKRTAVYQLGRLAKPVLTRRQTRLVTQDTYGAVYATWRRHRREAPRYVEELPPLEDALSEFRGYLTATANLARDAEVELVFATQPFLWRDDLSDAEEAMLWFGGLGDFRTLPA